MTANEALGILNNEVTIEDADFRELLKQWQWLYYGMSLHTLGITPDFDSLRTGVTVSPLRSRYYNSCHEAYQYIFDEHLFARHPSESDDARNYRYSVYRPLTSAPLLKLHEIVTSAIFQDSDYTIEIQNEEDNKYIWSNVFSGNDIASYFANIGYASMIEDPNGFFLRIPKFSAAEQRDGKPPIDIWFIKTEDIVYITPKHDAILFKKGYNEAYFIDKQDIWHISKDPLTKKYTEATAYYRHKLGRLPITVAGGHWNSKGYYDSYYVKAKPICDEFVATFSAAQVVDKEASHPIIIEPDTDCTDCEGAGFTFVPVQNSNEKSRVSCKTCDGEGRIHRNPMQRGLMSKKDFENKLDIRFVNPDININKHHRETVKELYAQILDALNLTVTEQAQSGVAKAIDQERLYRFIMKMADRLFDIVIYDTLWDIIQYRNVEVSNNETMPAKNVPFTIVKPKSFSLETSETLIEKYGSSVSAQLPMSARTELLRSFIDKEHGGNDTLKKKFDFIIYSDPYATATTGELSAFQATPEEIKYHVQLPTWLDRMITAKGDNWFVTATYDKIESELQQYKK